MKNNSINIVNMEMFQYFYKLVFLPRQILLFKNVKLTRVCKSLLLSKWLKSNNEVAKLGANQHFNKMRLYCFDKFVREGGDWVVVEFATKARPKVEVSSDYNFKFLTTNSPHLNVYLQNNKIATSSGLFVSLIKKIIKMGETEQFDIEKVTVVFANSLHGDDDVLLEDYLTAYEEINKFFQLMGSVFGFVSSDLRAKLDILIQFRKNDPKNFTSIKSMIIYEKESDLFKDKKYVSGSRTLLRLHRGLEFVYEFLLRIQGIDDTQKTADSCKSAYNDTLSKHHPFLVRKGALVAMFALPTKGDLLNRVCIDVELAKKTLPEMLRKTRTVYDRTESLYTEYDLHNLP